MRIKLLNRQGVEIARVKSLLADLKKPPQIVLWGGMAFIWNIIGPDENGDYHILASEGDDGELYHEYDFVTCIEIPRDSTLWEQGPQNHETSDSSEDDDL
jgi:hypothetical protein